MRKPLIAAACLLAAAPAAARADAGWGPPRELSTPDSAPLSLAATAGLDPRGGAVVLWHGEAGVAAVIRAAGRGFGKPRAIPRSKLSMPDLRPALAFDARGAAVAVWSYFDPRPRFVEDGFAVDYRFGLRVASRGRSGTFSGTQTLTEQLDSDPSADVAVDPGGNAVVVWTDDAGMHAAARPAGSRRFGRAKVVGNTQADPHVSTGARGSSVAAWSGPGTARVAVARKGAAFGRPARLAISGLGRTKPVLGVDSHAVVTAAWASRGRVMAATCSATGRCSRPRALSPAGERASDPAVAVAPDGTAVVAWRTRSAVSAATRRGRGAFGAARVLAAMERGERASDVSVAVGTGGDVAALWTVDSRTGDVVRAAAGSGSRFAKAATLSPSVDGASFSDPQVKVDPRGNAVAVWGAVVDGRPSINAALFGR